MQIDIAGTYLLKYTAEDECGNATEVTREVEAVQVTYRTVLYADGTFIINEKSTDIDANVAEHGAATNVYNPLVGSTSYNFPNNGTTPWYSQRSNVLKVEIGSPINPQLLAHWFSGFDNCTHMDLSNLNTEGATTMRGLFLGCSSIDAIDVSHFDTSDVTDMRDMFGACSGLQSLDLSSFDTHNVTRMDGMFVGYAGSISPNLSSFDTKAVTHMIKMFESYHCETLDISSFELGSNVDCDYMFRNNRGTPVLTTIYASGLFDNSKITSAEQMFSYQNQLVGGSGTRWSSSYTDKTYARIDNPPTEPGYFTLKSA